MNQMNDDLDDSPFEVITRYQRKPPVDVGAIARDLGVKVDRMSLGGAVAGTLTRDSRRGGWSGFLCLINSDDHPRRQRFTLAHELAHFILHRDLIDTSLVDDTMYRGGLSDPMERQANKLAADILMPVWLIRGHWDSGNRDPMELARLFEVSPKAMEIRLKPFHQDVAAG